MLDITRQSGELVSYIKVDTVDSHMRHTPFGAFDEPAQSPAPDNFYGFI